MWDWTHLKNEGWVTHTRRALKLSALLLVSGGALILHLLIPFWQQPKVLQVCSVANIICKEMEKRE
jgi:hypothetical protein